MTSRNNTSAFRVRTSNLGFTLVELVLVLLIIAALAAATIPAVTGLRDQSIAKVPAETLAKMALEARTYAMAEGRPYQILFDQSGFSSTRFFNPYAERFEIDDFLNSADLREEQRLEEIEAAIDDAEAANNPLAIPASKLPELAEKYTLDEDTSLEVQFWAEPEPAPLASGIYRPWVFQPTGLCNPIRVRFDRGNGHYEVTFNALTAQIESESYDIP